MTIVSTTTVSLNAIHLFPGSHLLISDVAWEQYETFLHELGEDRSLPRINYSNCILEIMSPLPIHERPHRLIGDIVKILLDAQNRDLEDFGSTTFRKPERAGLEPDTCFYIQNAARVRGCLRINLEKDPPPDLAIESDVTSKTTLAAYKAIGVPEVWVYEDGRLTIYLLQASEYILSETSFVFPTMPIVEMIPRLVQRAFQDGSSTVLRELRSQLAQDS